MLRRLAARRAGLGFAVSLGICLLLGIAPAADAAQGVKFDTGVHLDGWDEALFSEYSDVYRLEPFEEFHGTWIKSDELAELKRAWTTEKERALQEIRLIQTDPKAGFLFRLEQSFDRHPHLQEVEYVRVDDFDPIFFYVELPAKEKKGYAGLESRIYGAFLRKTFEEFRARYADPAGLRERPDHGAFALLILKTRGSYEDFMRSEGVRGHAHIRAHYSPKLRLSVTYNDPGLTEQRRSAIHEMTHALQHAFRTGGDGPPLDLWFTEGLAEHLSSFKGNERFGIDLGTRDSYTLEQVARLGQADESLQGILFFPVKQLVSFRSYADIQKQALARAAQARYADSRQLAAISVPAFYAQSQVFVRFLETAEDGLYLEPLQRYVRSAMIGEGGVKAFEEAFAKHDVDKLDESFRDYLDTELLAIYERWAGPRAAAAKRSGDRDAASESNKPNAPAASTSKWIDPSFDPTTARISPADPKLRLAGAVVETMAGRFPAALESVDSLVEACEAGPARDRLSRERDRIRALADLRRLVLESYRHSGKNLKIPHGAGNYLGKIIEVGEDEFRMKRRTDELTLPVTALRPRLLGSLVWGRKIDAPKWAAAYAYLLDGDPAMTRKLLKKDTSSQGRELTADLADYETIIPAGEVWTELRGIFDTGRPGDATAAEALAARIRTLLSERGDHSIVSEQRENLKKLAALCLAAQFDVDPLSKLVSAEVKRVGDGEIEITYDFDDPKQLADFEPEPAVLKMLRKGPKLATRQDEPFRIEHGRLVAHGNGCLSHRLDLEPNITIRYDLTYELPEQSMIVENMSTVVSVSELRGERVLSMMRLGDLVLFANRSGSAMLMVSDKGLGMFRPDASYDCKLVVDDKRAVGTVDGDDCGKLTIGGFGGGRLVISVYSDVAAVFDSLTIRGKISAATTASARDQWLAKQMRLQFPKLVEQSSGNG